MPLMPTAMLPSMGITAMIRNLANMTRGGLSHRERVWWFDGLMV